VTFVPSASRPRGLTVPMRSSVGATHHYSREEALVACQSSPGGLTSGSLAQKTKRKIKSRIRKRTKSKSKRRSRR